MIVDGLFYQLSLAMAPLQPLMKYREDIMIYPRELGRDVCLNSPEEGFKKLQNEVYHLPSHEEMLKREGEDFLGKHFGKKEGSNRSQGTYEMKTGHVRFFERPVVLELQSAVASLFGTRCQLLGDFLYPPGGFRSWHTNRYDLPKNQNDVWAIFFVFAEEDDASFFRFIDPDSGEMMTAWDKKACANIFRTSRDPAVWHCIRSESTSRWSVGFHLPDHWQEVVFRD